MNIVVEDHNNNCAQWRRLKQCTMKKVGRRCKAMQHWWSTALPQPPSMLSNASGEHLPPMTVQGVMGSENLLPSVVSVGRFRLPWSWGARCSWCLGGPLFGKAPFGTGGTRCILRLLWTGCCRVRSEEWLCSTEGHILEWLMSSSKTAQGLSREKLCWFMH